MSYFNLLCYYSVTIRGYDRCWFFGDAFCNKSFEQYFQACSSTDYNGYTKAHFDTTGYFGCFYRDNPSLLSRMSNILITAIETRFNNKLLPLPKLIIIVPDNDIISLLKEDPYSDVTKGYSRLLNYLMSEYDRSISAYKEYLPAKSLRPGYPQLLWIQAPLHDAFNDNDL